MDLHEWIEHFVMQWDRHRRLHSDEVPPHELSTWKDCPFQGDAHFKQLVAEAISEFKRHELQSDSTSSNALARRDTEVMFAASRISNYELIKELGRGGMGVVYEARHIQLNRLVALKMILSGPHARTEDLVRFQSEGQALASLQHRNIVQIYEVGEHEGQPFLSMEIVEGGSLADYLGGTPLPVRKAAELTQAMACAMQHAHTRGIIHRDLKPANVLMASNVTPMITDFGMAKRLGVSGLTHSLAAIGTPSYMAPEQAWGQSSRVGPAADIYALGAILYEMLTGRPPFKAETRQATLEEVKHTSPVHPSLLNRKVDIDLESICCCCLEKDPQDRYPSAQALADDLARYLMNRPVSCRPPSALRRLLRLFGYTQYRLGEDFRCWAPLFFILAVIAPVPHVAAFLIRQGGLPGVYEAWAQSVGFIAFVAAILYFRFVKIGPPKSDLAKQAVPIIISDLLGSGVSNVVTLELGASGPYVDYLAFYPHWCVINGVVLFIMGSSYWGGFYVASLAFFLAAIAMPFNLALAPVAFGVLWLLTYGWIGLKVSQGE